MSKEERRESVEKHGVKNPNPQQSGSGRPAGGGGQEKPAEPPKKG